MTWRLYFVYKNYALLN